MGDAPFGQAVAPAAQPMPLPTPQRPPAAADDADDLLGDAAPFGQALPSSSPPPPPAVAWTEETSVPPQPRPAAPPPPAAVPRASAPPPQAPPPAAAPLATAPAAAGAAPGDAAALLAVFLAGAGIPDLPLAGQDPEATLRAAGEIFRILVEGLREVLMSRAAIKNELRVEQTVLRAKNNNALKFSVSPEEALAALLVPNRPGYKPPAEATREAFADIKSHELAVMAGVQTALLGLLKRFDPTSLETRLQPGKLDSIMPAARKARIWELFCVTYKEIAREAEDDFQSVFGREFARAYDAQSQKL
jgi:type VI secretion system FHA domain protein